MKHLKLRNITVLIILLIFTDQFSFSQQDLVKYVDPFIGTQGGGKHLPGACLPFSMVQLSPDVSLPNSTQGYNPDKAIDGFSHVHTSGTGGGGRYGNIMVIPETGQVTIKQYFSEKSGENASPGYYSVYLNRWNVKAELTLTERCGMHRYTFNSRDTAHVLIDLSRLIKSGFNDKLKESNYKGTHPPNWDTYQECVGGFIEIVSDQRIEGHAEYQGGWGPSRPYQVYFSAEFNRPFDSFGTWNDTSVFYGQESTHGKKVGGFATFNPTKNNMVLLKVGISFVSVDKARKNLYQVQDWNFDAVHQSAEKIWNSYLNKIQVAGVSEDVKKIFYTAFYHTLLLPTDLSGGENPRWESDEPHYWNFYTIWDTFRCLHPFFSLIIPERQAEMVRCLIDIYEHTGWAPDAWIAGGHGNVQGGTNSDVVIADAILKNLPGIDHEKAYEAMYKNGKYPSDNAHAYGRFLYEYFQNGYCSDNITYGVSRTLEYAYNDYCIAAVAKKMGLEEDYQFFLNQSLNCYNIFNDSTNLFEPKSFSGEWLINKEPQDKTKPYYYEGTPMQYATYVLHDIPGLIEKHGGEDYFEQFLDKLFEDGHYTQSNEPDILAPYLYNYVGRPDKTVERVRNIMDTEYKAARNGLPGNDDSGTMSAWYIFSALGFYPVAGQDIYLIGSPVFSSSKIDIGNGNFLVIEAKNVSDKNKYIHSVTLNGKSWNKAWFRHKDIMDGAKLVFQMGSKPAKWGNNHLPPSALKNEVE